MQDALSVSTHVRDLFVRLLAGDEARYEKCCAEATGSPDNPHGLTPDERLAVWFYTSTDEGWYKRINSELWGTPSPDILMLEELLNQALQKFPAHGGMVFRGYRPPDLDSFIQMFDVGAVIKWPGFTSTARTREKAFAGNVLFIIRSQSGKTLGDYADKPSEEEILFPSGCRFLVKALERDNNFAVIELEERLA